MRHEFADARDKPGPALRCAVLILAQLVVNPILSPQTPSPAPQAQPTMKKVVKKKSTNPSTCYAVQVGAYEDRAQGEAMLNKLMPAFPDGMTLTEVVTRGKPRWRLRVPTTSMSEALKVSGRLLGEQQIKAWIDPIPCTIPLAVQRQNSSPRAVDNIPRSVTSDPRAVDSSPRALDNNPHAIDNSEFGSFLRTFGAAVPRWKAIISTVDVSSLSVSGAEGKQLEQWRTLSLKCLDFVENDTLRLSTKVSLSDQIRLLDDLNRLSSNVSGLGNSLSYLATAEQARDIPKAQQWARVLLDVNKEILAEYQKFYLHLVALAATVDSAVDKNQ